MNSTFTSRWLVLLCLGIITIFSSSTAQSQEMTVAMKWSEMQLNCIRRDAARPTIQARNLYHASIVMYDAWAIFDNDSKPVLIGNTLGNYTAPFNGITPPMNAQAAQEEAISYAMYRFLRNRYINAPNNNWALFLQGECNALMAELGYDISITSTDYTDGDPAKLGNYIATQMQAYGLQDGSNQQNNYANQYYQTVNTDLVPHLPGNPGQTDGNRWQPLSLILALDQNGFPIPNGAPALSAEWGNVVPFALTDEHKTTYQRDGNDWNVYLDQGVPPLLDTLATNPTQWDEDFWKWGNTVVALWHSFHDTSDGVLKDISPNAIGNVSIDDFPTTFEEFKVFYNEFEGGSIDQGYDINPITGLPYAPNVVPRADYSRVLSEYWADGPSSETPPGHWFKNINAISRHPMLVKRWEGQGPILEDLEWDVRSYLALGGAIHDAAIACWSTKGYYDFTRPIMAIRYMIDRGQSSDPNLPSYHPAGIPLLPGYIELIEEGDPLAGENNEHLGKVKLYTWRGPMASTGQDGVGWIRGENWWTFQRHTFVTPPFPGYYSGHSTYSRTAAEVLTRITGSEYYPGGMGEFVAAQNQYLMATTGPSVETRLQWARYADAADQCSLSRIYGGLHPPCDDIPGRRVGLAVGPLAFDKADSFITAHVPHIANVEPETNAIDASFVGQTFHVIVEFTEPMNMMIQPNTAFLNDDPSAVLTYTGGTWLNTTTFELEFTVANTSVLFDNIVIQVSDAMDLQGNEVIPALSPVVQIDMQAPQVLSTEVSSNFINDASVAEGNYTIDIAFNEPMSVTLPIVAIAGNDASNTMQFNPAASSWVNNQLFRAAFDLSDANEEVNFLALSITAAKDQAGNTQAAFGLADVFSIDTKNPAAVNATASQTILADTQVGSVIEVSVSFDEAMNTAVTPTLQLQNGMLNSLGLSTSSVQWNSSTQCTFELSLIDEDVQADMLQWQVLDATDVAGNEVVVNSLNAIMAVDTQNPLINTLVPSDNLLSDSDNSLTITVSFDEAMATNSPIDLAFSSPIVENALNLVSADWIDSQTFEANYSLEDTNSEVANVTASANGGTDLAGNLVTASVVTASAFALDTRNPELSLLLADTYTVGEANVATNSFELIVIFDEPMQTSAAPVIDFPTEVPSNLTYSASGSAWLNSTTFSAKFNVSSPLVATENVDVRISAAFDAAGNAMESTTVADHFDVQTAINISDMTADADRLSIYPNPLRSGEVLIIKGISVTPEAVVTLVTSTGQRINGNALATFGNGTFRLATAALSAGIYFLEVSSNEEKYTEKFTVIK